MLRVFHSQGYRKGLSAGVRKQRRDEILLEGYFGERTLPSPKVQACYLDPCYRQHLWKVVTPPLDTDLFRYADH